MIMKRANKLTWLFIFLAFACSENKSIKQISFPSIITLQGKQCFTEEIGLRELNIVDTFLIIKIKDDSIFHIYNKKSHKYLSSIGNKGRGPKEFLSPRIMGSYFQEDTLSGVWVFDRQKSEYSLVDIVSSLKNKMLVKSIELNIPRTLILPINIFCVNGSNLVGGTEDNYIVNFDLNADSVINKISLIEQPGTKNLPFERKMDLYFNYCELKPDESKMVCLMSHYPQLHSYKINKNNGSITISYDKGIVLGENPGKYNESQIADQKITVYYEDLYVTNKYLYLLCLNQLNSDVGVVEKAVSIQVLNWDYKPVCLFNIPEYLRNFVVDEESGKLYGINFEADAMYQYDIGSHLKFD